MPGDSKCAGYSSTNFEVLGLLLLQQANVDSIQEYDQLSFLKTSSRKIDRDFATELQSDGMVSRHLALAKIMVLSTDS
jgi:hypothetical protein